MEQVLMDMSLFEMVAVMVVTTSAIVAVMMLMVVGNG
tara:strand:+ start:237 stop:347 length:111 start_codon:yes stop_codon:yes gene_type:complete